MLDRQKTVCCPLAFCLGQCGKEQSGKDRDDGDHHQKLDQGKRPVRSITIACPLVEQLVVVCRYFYRLIFDQLEGAGGESFAQRLVTLGRIVQVVFDFFAPPIETVV